MAGPYTFGSDTREPLYLGSTKGDGATLGGIQGLVADLHARIDVLERGGWSPSSQGYLAWAYAPKDMLGSSAASSGVPQISRIAVPLYSAATFSNIDYFVVTPGSGLTASQNYISVYSSAGVKLGQVGQDSNFVGTGKQTATFGTPINLADTGGYLFVSMLSNGTTPPAIARTSSAISGTAYNANLAATASRGATGPGSATAPPSSIGTLIQAANQLWFGLRT
ncbi:MAG: hypothetical protein JWO99_729 [Candidatus Saccharibacteria bacterium]|nr:hypothetical protein [Candidatus Saccharibacteria bacterium]